MTPRHRIHVDLIRDTVFADRNSSVFWSMTTIAGIFGNVQDFPPVVHDELCYNASGITPERALLPEDHGPPNSETGSLSVCKM